MKTTKTLFITSIALCAALLTGCGAIDKTLTSSNPAAVSDPSQPAFVVNTNLPATISKIQNDVATMGAAVSAIYPPAAPAVPIANELLTLLGGLVVAGAGIYARAKSVQATAHSNAAAAMAATIAAQPQMVTAALQNASQNGSSSTVAQHLAEANNPVQL